jgi:peptidoglycan/LPS O-acetylase OafA/YrhL
MGTFRFVLALLVALSHTPGAYMKGNYGASSVLAFYFLSGWLMAMSFQRFKAKKETPVSTFYLDRFMKLWPSYAMVFLVSLVFFQITGVFQFDWRRVPLELLLIPNAFTKMIPWNEAHALNIVPPSWSLGVEACFYVTVPFLATLSYRIKIIAAYAMVFGHLFVMLISSTVGRFIDCELPLRPDFCMQPVSDYFGFDFPLFAGVTFLLGQIAYERFHHGNRTDLHLLAIWAIYTTTFLIVAPAIGEIQNPGVYEILLSMSFFLPVAFLVLMLTKHKPQPSWDRLLGDLSYPLFLSHFFGRYVIEYAFGTLATNPWFYSQAVATYLPLAILLMLFQNFIDRLRYAARGFEPSRSEPKPGGIA